MNYHFMIDDKFIDDFILDAETVAPKQNTYIFTFNQPARYVKSTAGIHAPFGSKVLIDIINRINNNDRVYIHWFHDLVMQIIENIDKKIPVYLFFWGGDFLSNLPQIDFFNVDLFTRKLVSDIDEESIFNKIQILTNLQTDEHPQSIHTDLEKYKKNYSVRNQFLSRLNYFCHWNKLDFDIVKAIYSCKAEFLPFFYNPKIDKISITDSKNNAKPIIWLGNSDTFTNNHVDAIEFLGRFSNYGIEVICPLSYGNNKYGDEIDKIGFKVFNNNWKSIRQFMPFDEYINTLANVDIVLMFHNRTQAAGNIIAFLLMGKKVYLKSQSTIYKLFRDNGINIYDANLIKSISYNDFVKPLTKNQIIENLERVSNLFSEKIRLNNLLQILNPTRYNQRNEIMNLASNKHTTSSKDYTDRIHYALTGESKEDMNNSIIHTQTEHHGTEYGGWTIASEFINPKSIIYSFGIGEDISFDLSVINIYGVNIFAFDPTPKSLNWLKQQNLPHNFRYYDYGLADFDGYVKFYPPENPDHVSHTLLYRSATSGSYIEVPVKSLKTIMAELGHTKIDILKMDIEGAEYAVIDHIIANNIQISQLLVEFHDRFEGVESNKSKLYIKKLHDFGYQTFSISESGFEYSFLKNEVIDNSYDDSPVILMTYNRPQHTAQVLDSLRKHNIKNLFIYSDAPKSEKDVEGVNQTRNLISKIDWTVPTVVYQSHNQGLAKSIVSAVNKVFETFDRLILLEDDCVPQEYFFQFMHDCLNKYENNRQIFGISGYSVDISEELLKNYHYDIYFVPRIGSWGWATWKDRWQKRIEDLGLLKQLLEANGIDINQGGTDVQVMLQNMLSGKLKDVWTLPWLLTVYLHKGVYIYPTKSHIKNIGMDGTGVHCGVTEKFETKIADTQANRHPDNMLYSEELMNNFLSYYDVDNKIRKSHKMKVVHVCTQDNGGAGTAAYMLNKGLREIGVDSILVVLNKTRDEDGIFAIPDNYYSIKKLKSGKSNSDIFGSVWNNIEASLKHYPNKTKDYEIFTTTDARLDLSQISEILNADIINLHWVVGMIDFSKAGNLFKGKKVVWTLHDMNPFTGGCHYSNYCNKHNINCGQCPQLGSENLNDLSFEVFKIKEVFYEQTDINVVAPSKWLLDEAGKSSLFGRFPGTLIHYAYDINTFSPRQNEALINKINKQSNEKVILFGAAYSNKRKGFDYLLKALKRFEETAHNKLRFKYLAFGNIDLKINVNLKNQIFTLGNINDPRLLADIYSVADVFVIPSLEDNSPLVVIESLACGTPVVGFDIGGVPDLVEHKFNGYVAENRNSDDLAIGILWCLDQDREKMRHNSRATAEKKFDLQQQANKYLNLYNNILNVKSSTNQSDIIVSAIVSTYKSEQFIDGCLKDLVEQTLYKKGMLEIIVIDSNSPENEKYIVEKYQAKYPNIIYHRTQERETLYAAWNRGIRLAKGKYITNANTDDRHSKDALEVMANHLDNMPEISLVYSDCYMTEIPNETFEQNNKAKVYKYPDYFAPDCLLHYQFGINPMWRKEVHDQIGYFDDSYRIIGDYDFNVRFALKLKAYHINQVLGLYYLNPDSLSFQSERLNEEISFTFTKYRQKKFIFELFRIQGISNESDLNKANILKNLGYKALEHYPPWMLGAKHCEYDFGMYCLNEASRYEVGIKSGKQNKVIKNNGTEKPIFENIFKNNAWGSEESVSGPGSTLEQTQVIRKVLPKLIRNLKVQSILDIPCGDFNWMKEVDLNSVNYIGADIVDEIIERNKMIYAAPNKTFINYNLKTDKLPKVDLVIIRDCLVHFSYEDIFLAIENVIKSGSKYLLTTSFTNRYENNDIRTGDWRPINLQVSPFNFIKPLLIINEQCTEDNGIYSDKSLLLFEIDKIYLSGSIRNEFNNNINKRNKSYNKPLYSKLLQKYLIGSRGIEIEISDDFSSDADPVNDDTTTFLPHFSNKNEFKFNNKEPYYDTITVGKERFLPDSCQDFILSSFILEHLPNPIHNLLEWDRICKVGGVIIIIVSHKDRVPSKTHLRTTLQNVISSHWNVLSESDFGNKLKHSWITEDVVEICKWIINNLGVQWDIIEVQDNYDLESSGFALVIRKINERKISQNLDKIVHFEKIITNSNKPISSKKILIVAHNFLPLHYGGVEVYTYQFSKELSKLGNDVSIFYPLNDKSIDKYMLTQSYFDGLNTFQLRSNYDFKVLEDSIYNIEAEQLFEKFLLVNKFDIIHFQHIVNLPLSFFHYAEKYCKNVFITLHDFYTICNTIYLKNHVTDSVCSGPTTARKCAECIISRDSIKLSEKVHKNYVDFFEARFNFVYKAFNKAKLVTSPTDSVGTVFINHGFLDRILEVPLGIKHVNKEHSKLNEENIVYGYLGTINAQKNIFKLIDTFVSANSKSNLEIYGSGSDKDINQLMLMINKYPNIKYNGAYKPEDLPFILGKINLLIHPSESETYGIVIREALSAKVPVLASKTSGGDKVLRHFENSIIFENNNFDELKYWIMQIDNNPYIIKRLTKFNTKIVSISEDALNWSKIYNEHYHNKFDSAKGHKMIISNDDGHKNPIKIGILTLSEKQNACFSLRIEGPLKIMISQGLVEVVDIVEKRNKTLSLIEEKISIVDLIIVQREMANYIKPSKLKYLSNNPDLKIIYEADDALTNIEESHPQYKLISSMSNGIEEFIKEADFVTVSTEVLKELYSNFNNKIEVLPNYLDELIWENNTKNKTNSPYIKIIFAGTPTHYADLEMIKNVIINIAVKYNDKVQIFLWGNAISELLSYNNIFEYKAYNHNYFEYAKDMANQNFDIALVPLEDNTFNCSKSNIKWLEYSACGTAGVFSNIAPYQNIENYKTGILVNNNYDEWFEAVCYLIDNSNIRMQIASNAKNAVFSSYTIQKHFVKWYDVFANLIKHKNLLEVEHYHNNLSTYTLNEPVSIIIPVFNKSELTKNCIESIYKYTDTKNFELIIIDNGSTDDTAQIISNFSKQYNNIIYIRNTHNLGYAKANNIGVRLAKYEYILLLNNDTVVTDNWLNPLSDIIDNDKSVAAVGSKLLFQNEKIQHAGVAIVKDIPFGDHLVARHLYYGYSKSAPEVNILMEYQALTGACLLIRKSRYFEVGGLDEEYWNAYEDVDFCFKLREKGYKLVYQPKSVVYHLESQSGPERLSGVKNSVIRLHNKWMNKIVPDFIINEDKKVFVNNNQIKAYKNINKELNKDIYYPASIIILTYNSAATIENCLNSVKQSLRSGDEVIIVDNNSRDNTIRLTNEIIEGNNAFKLIRNSANIGFSAGTNVGIRLSKNPIVIMLNPDTIVNYHWLNNLTSHFRDNELTAVGPVSNRVAGHQRMELYPKDDLSGWNLPDVADYFNKNFKGQIVETKLLIGFCLAVRREFIEKYGGLDEDLFLGNDDLELSWRIRTNGGKLGVALDSFVYHVGQASFRTEAKSHTDNLVQQSTDALFEKLKKYYGQNNAPHPMELWGIDWFRPSDPVYHSSSPKSQNNTPLTSIIILAKDQYEYTKECIDSIYAFTPENFELILVDNGSRDNIPNYFKDLQNQRKNVKVITNPENLGFPKGVNQGLRAAEGKYILIGNNDTVVTPGWLGKMIEAIEMNPEIGMVGPMSNNISGVQLLKDCNYTNLDELLKFASDLDSQYSGQFFEFPRLAFFCTLIKRDVIDRIGGLDEIFSPGNYEDDDYCMRAQVAGFKALVLKYVFVHHYRSRSFADDGNDAYRRRLERNRDIFANKWGGTPDEIWLHGKRINPPELFINIKEY